MLSEDEIECCKNEAKNYIEFMETAGDNAGWTRGILWYINKLETKIKKYELEKIPYLEGEISACKQIHEYDVNMINTLKGKTIYLYNIIDDIESKNKNIIEKLEKNNERDTESVKRYENMYRNATEEFYKKSYKRTIDMANARRTTRKEIIEILAKEKNFNEII